MEDSSGDMSSALKYADISDQIDVTIDKHDLKGKLISF